MPLGESTLPLSAIIPPEIDPTPIFEHFRGNHGTELLTAAVKEFRLFERLASGPRSEAEFRRELGLAERPAVVLFTAMKAMGLLVRDSAGRLDLTPLSREHLVPGTSFDVSNYVGLAAEAPGVKEMIVRLKTNKPAGAADEKGTAFIYREGHESAMEREADARWLTLALAGRAKNVAPHVARVAPLENTKTLLDVGGGTGIYAIACLQRHPKLRAIVWDRPEVLKVAKEMAEAHGVTDRLECRPGDMFADPVPEADAVLLSNVLHDWDVPQCRELIARCAADLPSGGQLLIHDVFLNDALDGPLPIALYSAALFALTEGRAYSAAEYCAWLGEVGLHARPILPTLIHCGVLTGQK
ncbi:MAG: methyltransferase domain-containing protein [Planctomycetes bacterium]|nr:methyltransferase domain-containing protein [Planctomycetota bacterium]